MDVNEELPALQRHDAVQPILAHFLAMQVLIYTQLSNNNDGYQNISGWQFAPLSLILIFITVLSKFLLKRETSIVQMVGVGFTTICLIWMYASSNYWYR